MNFLHTFLSFNRSVMKRIGQGPKTYCPQKDKAIQLFSALLLIRNVSLGPNQHIKIISDGQCDTKDWSNWC